MCKCLAKEVGCCCVRCVFSMLLSIFCGAIILIVLIGVAIYFIAYHNKGGTEKATDDLRKLINASKPDIH